MISALIFIVFILPLNFYLIVYARGRGKIKVEGDIVLEKNKILVYV